MSERRQSTRQKSFLRGCIYFNNRRSSTDCLIRDISPTGARLIFSDTVTIPDLVDLYIPQKEQTLRARVQWRHGDEVGIAFGALATGRAKRDEELMERVEKLETEVASLRKMLKRLKAEVAGDADEAA
jgi:PilZ domain-containing protein